MKGPRTLSSIQCPDNLMRSNSKLSEGRKLEEPLCSCILGDPELATLRRTRSHHRSPVLPSLRRYVLLSPQQAASHGQEERQNL